jgi:hypothetical protein
MDPIPLTLDWEADCDGGRMGSEGKGALGIVRERGNRLVGSGGGGLTGSDG